MFKSKQFIRLAIRRLGLAIPNVKLVRAIPMLLLCPLHLRLKLGGGDIVPVEGFRMRLDPTLYEDRAYWFIPHRYDKVERQTVLKQLPRDTRGWMIDIGANIGFLTLWLATRFPNSRILSIEPAPETYRRLKEHIELNQIKNVIPVQVGVLDTHGVLPFYYSDAYSGRSRFLQPAKALPKGTSMKMLEVGVVPLAELFAKYEIQQCVLMKLDIEGAEKRVLHHFFKHVPPSAHPKLLWVEYIHDLSLLEFVPTYGYRPLVQSNMNVVWEKVC